MMNTDFDVIVVGGGHAGIEAAHAAAKIGCRTLLITLNVDKIGLMPCNPAVGGVGKGHIVFEISALGGLMPALCSKTYLQARMLNTSKGPAVQGLRLQIDKHAYNKLSRQVLEQIENLTIAMDMVCQVTLNDQKQVTGVTTRAGAHYTAPAVILTTGTFLQGLIHIGPVNYASGRQGEEAVGSLSPFLASLGLKMGRLKTGTPPRLLKSSIDFSVMEQQDGDALDYLFEFYGHKVTNTHPCFITHTNEKTHQIIKDNLHLSAMYSGNIHGIGPRYCPSIEDKVSRFAAKTSHHIFVEPESADSQEVYPNGISTSLPLEVQKQYIQSIVGFEQAVIVRPGYAIEYDFVLPDQLAHTMELKTVPGLFLAGQINGTTGYEEAAGQGLMAGINAAHKALGKGPFILDRNESYIGVMIDDLVTCGVDEPYRMFTSRAERRLVLRQDNVFARLMPKGYALGLISDAMYQDFIKEQEQIAVLIDKIKKSNNAQLLHDLLSGHDHNRDAIIAIAKDSGHLLPERNIQTILAEFRYEPYLKREQKEIEKTRQYQLLRIPDQLDFATIPGLSTELKQKLIKHRPGTIAQASLIQGMTPAAISLLIFKSREFNQ